MSGLDRSRLSEALEIVRTDFKRGPRLKEISEEGLSVLPQEWQAFYKEFGIVPRKDGFIWIVDPADYFWFYEVFGNNIILSVEFIPVARNSFGDFYLIDAEGVLYSFLPQYGQLDRMSATAVLSIVALSEKSTTDDPPTRKQHQRQQKLGKETGYQTCYCLRPIVPLGGSEETSEIYVGDIKSYIEMIAQALS